MFLILLYFIHRPYTLGSDDSLIVHKEKEGTYIEVLGEVGAPGIYKFDGEVAVCDVIKRAGGLEDSLSIDNSFQSTRLKRGGKITLQRISRKMGRVLIERMDSQKLIILSIPIDLNTATQEELSAVPGLSTKVALDIIKYRYENGGFSAIEELKDVKGIGKVRYERMKMMLTVVRVGDPYQETDTDH